MNQPSHPAGRLAELRALASSRHDVYSVHAVLKDAHGIVVREADKDVGLGCPEGGP